MKSLMKSVFLGLVFVFGVSLIFIYPPLVELWIENDSINFYERIRVLYTHKVPSILIFFIIGLGFTITFYIYNLYNVKKNKYEEKSEAVGRILLQKYEELRSLSISRSIGNTLEKFCNKYSFVSAAQLYRYVETSKWDSITVKVTYEEGFAKDLIDVNGIIQHHYEVDKKIHRRYTKAINQFFKDVEDLSGVDKVLDFIEQFTEQLGKKAVEDLDFKDGITYELVKDCYHSLYRYYPEISKPKMPMDTLKGIEDINKRRRLGILRGIELNNKLMFQYHKGSRSEKEGRVYITNTITLEDKKHILLLSIDPELLDEEEEIRLQLEKVLEEIEILLFSVVEKVYNEIEEVNV